MTTANCGFRVNDNPANKVRIASVPDWTDSRQWNKFPTQKSAAITLTAGQRYYVEALQKEGGRWRQPCGGLGQAGRIELRHRAR